MLGQHFQRPKQDGNRATPLMWIFHFNVISKVPRENIRCLPIKLVFFWSWILPTYEFSLNFLHFVIKKKVLWKYGKSMKNSEVHIYLAGTQVLLDRIHIQIADTIWIHEARFSVWKTSRYFLDLLYISCFLSVFRNLMLKNINVMITY